MFRCGQVGRAGRMRTSEPVIVDVPRGKSRAFAALKRSVARRDDFDAIGEGLRHTFVVFGTSEGTGPLLRHLARASHPRRGRILLLEEPHDSLRAALCTAFDTVVAPPVVR